MSGHDRPRLDEVADELGVDVELFHQSEIGDRRAGPFPLGKDLGNTRCLASNSSSVTPIGYSLRSSASGRWRRAAKVPAMPNARVSAMAPSATAIATVGWNAQSSRIRLRTIR